MFEGVMRVAEYLIAAINIIGFIIVGVDKYKARYRMWRIPERTFFVIGIIGGCPGVYAGLLLFRHKIQKWYFMYGFPFIFFLQLLLIIWIVKQ
ncbi:MAG: DUF1294 domain-containing protein [Clostridia bacterium]|nr:DUF1294 domain-containing protein [Clostridia bacterium]